MRDKSAFAFSLRIPPSNSPAPAAQSITVCKVHRASSLTRALQIAVVFPGFDIARQFALSRARFMCHDSVERTCQSKIYDDH